MRTFGKDSLDAYNAQKAEAQALHHQRRRDAGRTARYVPRDGKSLRQLEGNLHLHVLWRRFEPRLGRQQRQLHSGSRRSGPETEDRRPGKSGRGTAKTVQAAIPRWPVFICITSDDLYNWTDEGVVLRTVPVSSEDYGKDQNEGYKADYSIFETDPYFSALYGDCGDQEPDDPQYENKAGRNLLESRQRPQCHGTSESHLLTKIPASMSCGSTRMDVPRPAAEATAVPAPALRFPTALQVRSSSFPPSVSTRRNMYPIMDLTVPAVQSRDMNLFQDEDGTAYVIYSSDIERDDVYRPPQ